MLLILLISFFINSGSDPVLFPEKEISGFRNALSISNDGKGALYVIDNESCEIIKYNEFLSEIKRTGKKGWNDGEFDTPVYVDCSSGLDVYVSDRNNSRIQRFDLNLSFVSSLYTNTQTFDEKLKVNYPSASVILNMSDLYVVDDENKRIVYYPRGIQPYFSFGGFESAEKPLIKPVKILKDGYNRLYVLDRKQNSIFVYDNFGTFVKIISLDKIISFSISGSNLYILTGAEILVYDTNKNAYQSKIIVDESSRNKIITDFLAYSPQKFVILEKNTLTSYKLIK